MVIEHSLKGSDENEIDLSMEHIEPMLQENMNRFVLFPIQHTEIWEMYKLHAAAFWTGSIKELGYKRIVLKSRRRSREMVV